MNTKVDRARLIREESSRLRLYLAGLAPEAWDQPSACDAWQVRDVVAHLTGGAEFYIEVISLGLKGDSSPQEGRPPAGSVNANTAAEGLVRRGIATREELGDRLLPAFVSTSKQLNELMASLGPQDWDRPCYHPAGVLPVLTIADMRVGELAVHGWDIRSRLDSEARISSESLPAIMDAIQRLTKWAFWPGARLPSPVRYRLNITGPSPRALDIVVEGDGTTMQPAGPGPADVTLRCDAETFVLCMYGRLAFGSAIDDGRVQVDGDLVLAARLDEWFKGI